MRGSYQPTRSGMAYTAVEEPAPRYRLPIAWYASKPAWMTHIPGPWLRFGNRDAFDHHLGR